MSDKYEIVKTYYRNKLWTEKQVRNAVTKKWITEDEFFEITGKKYIENNSSNF